MNQACYKCINNCSFSKWSQLHFYCCTNKRGLNEGMLINRHFKRDAIKEICGAETLNTLLFPFSTGDSLQKNVTLNEIKVQHLYYLI